jgi:hypothetical protein
MPPVTLSKQQFLRKKPGGKYENYLNYIKARRTANPKTQPITSQQLAQRIYSSILSPGQQRKEATWMVNQALKGQREALAEAAAEERKTAERQALAAEGFGKAFAPMQASFDESIRNAYAQGTGGISSDVSSLANALQGQQQGALDAANADLARLGAGTAPVAAPGAGAAQLQEYGGLQASVPGAMATGYHSGAAPLTPFGGPSVTPQVARAADIGSEYRHKAVQTMADLRKAVAKLEEKRPGLLREAMSGFGEQNLQTLAALTNVLTLQNTIGETQADITAGVAKTAAQKERDRIANLAKQGLSPDGKTPLPGYYRPAPGAAIQKIPSGWDWDPKTKSLIPRPASRPPKTDAKGAAAFTPAEKVQLEADFRSDSQDYIAKLIAVDPDLGRPLRKPPKKADIVRVVFNNFGRQLLRAGYKEGQIKAWATQIVNSFPNRYWDPSTYGKKKGGKGGKTGVEDVVGGTS